MLGVAAFATKGACSLIITWSVASVYDSASFAVWATFFSLAAIVSIADMGTGQLVLTTFHSARNSAKWERELLSNSIALLVLASAATGVIAYAAVASSQVLRNLEWSAALIFATVVRLPLIPHLAYLAALERYHERKMAEAGAYAVGSAFVLWGLATDRTITVLLLGLNLIFSASAVFAAARAYALGMHTFDASTLAWRRIGRIASDSLPYFVNNVSGLAVYGGFVAASTLVLKGSDLGRVALLHNLLLLNLYQVFELVFRTVQTRLQEFRVWRTLTRGTVGGFVLASALIVMAGTQMAELFFPQYHYSHAELLTYGCFTFLEIYYLLVTSSIQMQVDLRQSLQRLGLAKGVGFIALIGLLSLFGIQPSLLAFSFGLVIYSATLCWMASSIRASQLHVSGHPVTS